MTKKVASQGDQEVAVIKNMIKPPILAKMSITEAQIEIIDIKGKNQRIRKTKRVYRKSQGLQIKVRKI
jgi:hypothetical protein